MIKIAVISTDMIARLFLANKIAKELKANDPSRSIGCTHSYELAGPYMDESDKVPEHVLHWFCQSVSDDISSCVRNDCVVSSGSVIDPFVYAHVMGINSIQVLKAASMAFSLAETYDAVVWIMNLYPTADKEDLEKEYGRMVKKLQEIVPVTIVDCDEIYSEEKWLTFD